jgi:hypothetical protein
VRTTDDDFGWPAPKPTLPQVHPAAGGGRPAHAPQSSRPDGVLIELRPSPLGADFDHFGDQLLVFADRIELRDRTDRVRQSIASDEVTDVSVQRRFTGAVLTIEALDGDPIVVKGVKPEQADQVAALVGTHSRLAAAGLLDDDPAPALSEDDDLPEASALAAPSPDAVSNAANRLAILNRSRLNEADLLRKLADLHRAGVLSDAEFSDKIALVGRLVSGETIVVV